MTAEEIFSKLGFNDLEAEVYVALLKHGPQTAYKIGKQLNRPTANVYKAVDVLSNNGAIEIEEGDKRVCRAIPIKSLTQQLHRTYKNKLDNAVEQLSAFKKENEGEGIFKLENTESVFQRAEEMLKRCERIAVVDAFPGTLEVIKESLNKLPKRGIEVFVEAYDPVKFKKSISVVIPKVSAQALKHWNAQQLNICIDGREFLVALFNADLTQLVQATYSNNLYLACMMHNGMMSEHRVHLFADANTMKEVDALKYSQKYFFNSKVPGLEELFRMYKH